jgi:hypothetical protein
MSQKKTLHSKNTKPKPVSKDSEGENEAEVAELDGPKAKKGVDIEAALEPAAIIDEKVEEDILPPSEDAEDANADELTLDDEELNPFGDKWEQ